RREAVVPLGNAGDLAELRHLGDHLGVVDRVERILGGELRGHQPQEVVLVHRVGAGPDLGGPGRGWQVGHVVGVVDRIDNAHCPSLNVSRVRVLAVCRTCTLFWYWRAVSTMSISSAAVSTPASQTSPFASASGWLGSWRR